jgi:hypothetical protein
VNNQILRTNRHSLLREKRWAKCEWQHIYAEKCQAAHLKINPKETWDKVFKLMEGFQTHHRKTIEKNFKFKDDRIAKKSDESTEILKAHFPELFNSQVGIDIAVLEDIPKHEVQQKLGDMLTAAEIKKTISKMANNKAPGLALPLT